MSQAADEDLCARLVGQLLPSIRLPSTSGDLVDVADTGAIRIVICCYPRTSQPGRPAPTNWDLIPGARGCTPQTCAFRDHHQELRTLGAEVFGLSTQTTQYQSEMATRLHFPFPILSDHALDFADALGLPTFVVDGERLIRRLTIITSGRRIATVLYPVSKPEENAEYVLAWLRAHPIPAI